MLIIFFTTCRLVLGSIFILAGIQKLRNIAGFHNSLETFKMVPAWSIQFLAWSIPMIELITGSAVFFNIQAIIATGILIFLLLVFIGLFIVAWKRHLSISCGCFGEEKIYNSYAEALLRNSVLLVLAMTVLYSCIQIKDLHILSFVSISDAISILLFIAAICIFCLFRMVRNILLLSPNNVLRTPLMTINRNTSIAKRRHFHRR